MTFWDLCAPLYDFAQRMNGIAYMGMVRSIANDIKPGDSVMECAAGTGLISIACAKVASTVLCTDMSENMLAIAKRHANREGLTDIEFANCDILNIDQADGAWDVVIASQVLHLLDDPKRAADELKRVAKRQVITTVALTGQLGRAAKLKVSLWKLLGFKPKHEFKAEGYRQFLCDIGLEPAEFRIIMGQMPMAISVHKK